MGFYFRKSVRLGPLRLNFSKSGVGVSAGVKGLRVGTGPRGSYVHAGAGGIYYRKSLSSRSSAIAPSAASTQASVRVPPPVAWRGIDSASSTRIIEQSADDLLAELNQKHRRFRLGPWLVLMTVFLLCAAIFSREAILYWLGASCGLFVLPALVFDRERKLTSIEYDLQSPVADAVQLVHDSFADLITSAAVWHVEAEGQCYAPKVNGGASETMQRSRVNLRFQAPPFVRCNIDVPCIPVGKQKLYFFPDRLLIRDAEGFGTVSYENLQMQTNTVQFVETGSPPTDCAVVGRTWRVVNRTGGPDLRYRDNPEYPVVRYETVTFQSGTGVSERLQVSKPNVVFGFSRSISQLRGVLKAVQQTTLSMASS
jgi:hypothetical protein